MHVFVSVVELDAPSRMQDMGQLQDNMTLWDLRNLCLQRVGYRLEPHLREISRHFWYNDLFLPYNGTRTLIKDITAASSVHLKLRPDHYSVQIGGCSPRLFAIDPELTASQVIDYCLQEGAWQCYDLILLPKRRLDPQRSLWDQGVLPSPEAKRQDTPELQIRPRRAVSLFKAFLIIGAAVLGLITGYLTR